MFFGQGSTLQARLFQRYAHMTNERRDQEVRNIHQLKTADDDVASISVSTASARNTGDFLVEHCNQEAQTSIVLETMRDIETSARFFHEQEEEPLSDEFQWISWDNESQFNYDTFEDEFDPKPTDGETLEHYSPRKIYAAELSKNMKLEMAANKQSTDILL